MVNQQVLTGKWNEVRGRIKQKWGELSNDDLRVFNGNVDQLVGRIQRKTGESRDAIEQFLGELADGIAGAVADARDELEERAADAAEYAEHGYQALRDGYDYAERTVSRRPAQSMAVAFGLGVVAGAGIALMFRPRTCDSTIERLRAGTRDTGRHVLAGLSGLMPHR
jgi:uncharacterized protein YjbJ (UPF0337 family)